MTIRIRYPRYVASQPLHGSVTRVVRPRPVIAITVVGPTGAHLINGLVDTGADDSVFPVEVGEKIGLDLSLAEVGTAHGVGGPDVEVRYVDVRLRIADNQEHREWIARVGFAPLGSTYALLGFAGFLQYFTACFHGDLEFVELTTNALYPGT